MAKEQQFGPPPEPPRPFVGRERELDWLGARLGRPRSRRSGQVLIVRGPGGIGKTALVAQYFSQHPSEAVWLWFNCFDWRKNIPDFREIFETSRFSGVPGRGFIVVFDSADVIDESMITRMCALALNWKAVESVVLVTRKDFDIRGREELVLEPLPPVEAQRLFLEKLALSAIDPDSTLKIIETVKGHPEAIAIMAAMASSIPSDQLKNVLAGKLYDLKDTPFGLRRDLTRAAKPTIVTASDEMIRRLQKEPDEVHKLSPRKYEELVADLLRDMGHEVTLTPETRDGGVDIFASMKTELGEILCLVDAKKYRMDKKIGVEMVRTLYGTLTHYKATSAMLVTTASFSKPARAMAAEHKFQLSLRGFADLVIWLEKYGTHCR